MAKVRIVNMMFYGFHGIYEYEREQGQKFYIDVEVETKDDSVAESDDVKDGVDTAAIYDLVKDVVENKRYNMWRQRLYATRSKWASFPVIGCLWQPMAFFLRHFRRAAEKIGCIIY